MVHAQRTKSFFVRPGYLQQYETLLKEINSHPGSEEVPPDQYEVETSALADRNLKCAVRVGDTISFPCCHDESSGDALAAIGMHRMPAHTLIYFLVLCLTYDILVCTSFWTDIGVFNRQIVAVQLAARGWTSTF